jgi:RNA-directed DNA polymerase
VLNALDRWIRRRLRCVAWKQWKRGRTRFNELRRRGVNRDLAAQTADNHGPWRVAKSLALHLALPNVDFTALSVNPLAAP